MIYITFAEYTELGGDLIPQDEFTKIARTMSRKVDGLTFNRILNGGFDSLTPFQQKCIKESMIDFCDFEYDNHDVLNSTISNYSINGVSVSYGSNHGGITIGGMMVSRSGYQILSQTGLTCRLI